MKRDALDKHLRRVLREAQQSYRRAIAAQVRGQEDGAEWAAFHEAAAALLLASWLAGAHGAVRKAKIPADAVESIVDAGTAMTFDRLEAPLSLEGFGTKWMKPITDWFRRRVPVSRDDWDMLVEAAKRSSGDVTDHERQNALPDMRRRSPILDSLLRGVTRPTEGAISTVKRIVNDTFFVTAMNPEQTRQVQELIAQVIEEKPGKSVVGKRIRMMNLGDFVTTTQVLTGTALSSARLETVLRTNTNRALTEGQAEVLRDERVQAFVPLVEYSATKDKRTRETHLALDGYVGTMADFDRMGITPPCGFNCFPAWQPVAGAFDIGYRALYRGTLVHLHARSGRTVAVTANHPILTDRGWIPAEQVKVGDKVLRCGVDSMNAPEGPGDHQSDELQVATASDVFDAITAQAVAKSGVASESDRHVFHGDSMSMQGEIEVVRSEGILMFDVLHAEPQQGIAQRQLIGAGSPCATLGSTDQFVHAPLAASDGIPRSTALPLDSRRVLLDPAPFERFGLPLRSQADTSAAKTKIDGLTGYAERFGDLVRAFPGAVTMDEIVDVDFDLDFVGHVYDFRSSSGIIVADGLIVSNCRCDLIPVPASMAVDRGWVRPNGALDYAAIKRHNGSRQRVIDARQIPDPGFVNA